MSNTEWIQQANCAGTDPDSWTAEATPNGIRTLKRICHECPVTAECFQYALDNGFVGVWGGTTTSERTKYKRRLRKAAVR